jgi:hypothetical protein
MTMPVGESRVRPQLALFGHGTMSELSPLSGVKRKLDFAAIRAAFDPTAEVHTCHVQAVLKRNSSPRTPMLRISAEVIF